MPQDDPTWSGFFHAGACIVILTYTQVLLGAHRMAQLKALATNLPAHQRLKVRFIGPILAVGLRMELVVMASLLPFLDKKKVFTGHLPADTHFAVSTQDIILFLGAVYLLFRLISTFSNQKTEKQPASEYTHLKTLFWLDAAWTMEVIFLGLGITNQIAPVLLSVLIAYLILFLWEQRIIHHKHNRLLSIPAWILALFSILMLVARGLGIHLPSIIS
jgi:predicted tellurium resistance membrane protein TerC